MPWKPESHITLPYRTTPKPRQLQREFIHAVSVVEFSAVSRLVGFRTHYLQIEIIVDHLVE
jgi:hypothetical protein